MKILEYYLLPESGYTGEYSKKDGHYMVKDGTVADMLHDSGILLTYDFNYTIPDIDVLNELLSEGYYGRLVEWEPFSVNKEEYNEIVRKLLSIKMPRPYRINTP